MSRRCALLVVATLLWTITFSTSIKAGEYHIGDTLICSDCHVMHYNISHSYSGNGVGFPPASGGPFGKLLKNNPNSLCLSCHDGQGWAPDVRGAANYVRQGGSINDAATAGTHPEWTGHTMGSKDSAPGGTWSNQTEGLVCIDCHSPHGIDEQYRNLWLKNENPRSTQFEGTAITYAAAVNDATKDVFISYQGSTGLERAYGTKAIWFNEPNQSQSAYGKWCSTCHKDFHGNKQTAGMYGTAWLRHPTAEANIGATADHMSSKTQYYSHTNRVKVMNPAGGIPADGAADTTPSCFSCHKAHGNKNAFGLIYMSGTGTVTEEGDTNGTKLENLCRQCHIQGG